MTEQRRTVRARTIYRGVIVYNNRSSTIDCLIRNFDDGGAKIVVDETMSFPMHFELEIPQKGRTYSAKIVWRSGNEVGVQFENELINNQPVLAGDELAGSLRELERENAALKKQVADLRNQLSRYFETV